MPDEYTGGLGQTGASALKQFLEAGGTVIFLNHSTVYAKSHLGLEIKSSTEGALNRDFYSPGSMTIKRLRLPGPNPTAMPPYT